MNDIVSNIVELSASAGLYEPGSQYLIGFGTALVLVFVYCLLFRR